jgi:hypothetical protein
MEVTAARRLLERDSEPNSRSGGLVGLASRPQRHLAGGASVTVTLALDVGAASAASGRAYAIAGPAGTTSWASSPQAQATAAQLASDVAAEISAATAPSSGGGGSVWDKEAARQVKMLPLSQTGAGSLSLSAVAGGVAVVPSSVAVSVCSYGAPCFAPTPGPTQAHPSPVPTPAPSRKPRYTTQQPVMFRNTEKK